MKAVSAFVVKLLNVLFPAPVYIVSVYVPDALMTLIAEPVPVTESSEGVRGVSVSNLVNNAVTRYNVLLKGGLNSNCGLFVTSLPPFAGYVNCEMEFINEIGDVGLVNRFTDTFLL